MEDDVGHADLAEVVQASGRLELADRHQRQLQVAGDRVAERDDLFSVAARVAVTEIEELGERADAGLEDAVNGRGALGVAPAQGCQGGKAVDRIVEASASGRRGAPDDRQRSELLTVAVGDRDLRDDAEAIEVPRRVEGAAMGCAGASPRHDPHRAGGRAVGDEDQRALDAREPAGLVHDQVHGLFLPDALLSLIMCDQRPRHDAAPLLTDRSVIDRFLAQWDSLGASR